MYDHVDLQEDRLQDLCNKMPLDRSKILKPRAGFNGHLTCTEKGLPGSCVPRHVTSRR